AGAAGQRVLGAGDDGDAPVAELEQVAGRGQAAVPVAGGDGGRLVAGVPRGIQQDERDAADAQPAALVAGEPGEDGDDAGRAAGEHVLDPAAAGGVATLKLGEDHAQVVLARHLLHAVEYLHAVLA